MNVARSLFMICVIVSVTVLSACGGSGDDAESVSHQDAVLIRAAEGKLSVAVSAAAVDEIKELRGQFVPYDPEAAYPGVAMLKMLDAVEGYGKSAAFTTFGTKETTLGAALARMANDIETYWPDHLKEVERVLNAMGESGVPAAAEEEEPEEVPPKGSAPTVTKASWIEEADAICARSQNEARPYKEEISALGEEGTTAATIRQAVKAAKKGSALVYREVSELEALGAPPGDEALIDRMLATEEAAIKLAEKAITDLAEGHYEEAEKASRAGEVSSAKARGLAQGYGLTVCGQEE